MDIFKSVSAVRVKEGSACPSDEYAEIKGVCYRYFGAGDVDADYARDACRADGGGSALYTLSSLDAGRVTHALVPTGTRIVSAAPLYYYYVYYYYVYYIKHSVLPLF